MMIPKIVHYCWFGPNKPSLTIRRCFYSWKIQLEDFEIKLWNEDNFDPVSHRFTRDAYQAGKYAFVADYVRMYALNRHGGVYLDADVEVVRNMSELLDNDFFIGLENTRRFGTSTIGAIGGHWLTAAMLEFYDRTPFDASNCKSLVNVGIVSDLLLDRGFSGNNESLKIDGDLQLPIGTFGVGSGVDEYPDTVYAKHLYAGSWKDHKNSRRISKYLRYGLWKNIGDLKKIREYKKQIKTER